MGFYVTRGGRGRPPRTSLLRQTGPPIKVGARACPSSSEALWKDGILRAGDEEEVNQRHDVAQRDVIATVWIKPTILISISFEQARNLAAILRNELNVNQQHDITERDFVRICTLAIGVAYPADTATQRLRNHEL